jgi:hypothetical protein
MAISTWKGQRFVCQNAGCGCEMEVIKAHPEGVASNPRCGCGSVMKKPCVKPSVLTHSTLKAKTSGA